jgi:peptidoglycan/LPS O-acetylase OafA/YrhL
MKHNQRFLWLDLIRGLSAIAVCAGHLRAAILQDYAHHAASRWWQPFYFATGLGHQAVMVFFVLSGFFVGGSVLKKGGDFQWSDYATARLTRLWTVLLPALTVTLMVDLITNAVAPDAIQGLFNNRWHSGPGLGEFSNSSRTWLANALFLQTVTSPVFGTNGPLWSLANEFWYYLLFPLCAGALGLCGRSGTAGRAVAAAIAAACLLWLPAGISMSYLVWLLGIAVWFVGTRQLLGKSVVTAWIGLGLFGVSLVISKQPSAFSHLLPSADFLIGIAFSVLAVGLVSRAGVREWPRPLAAGASAVSEFSYSLYLVHFPFVALLGSTIYRDQLAPGPVALLEYLGWLAALLALGAGFWWLFERRTNEVRRFVVNTIARLRLSTGVTAKLS